jgi:hypothetical protein
MEDMMKFESDIIREIRWRWGLKEGLREGFAIVQYWKH